MPTEGQLERYLKGEPLSEALAALKKGEEADDQDAGGKIPGDPNAGRLFAMRNPDELDDDDREHLRRLKVEPGWPIAFRVLDQAIAKQEQMAKAISEADPLGNRDKVAEQWAYIAMLKRARNLMVGLIDEEISKLKPQRPVENLS
jgi:hypothetical protein